jgi:hypothetical protein
MSFVATRAILLYRARDRYGSPLRVGGSVVRLPAMIVFILLGWVPWPLALALAVCMWLTVVELLEWRPHYVWWIWWLLLVFMTNFVGYLVLRAYRVYRRFRVERA